MQACGVFLVDTARPRRSLVKPEPVSQRRISCSAADAAADPGRSAIDTDSIETLGSNDVSTSGARVHSTTWASMLLELPLELAALGSKTNPYWLRKRKRSHWWSRGEFPKACSFQSACMCVSWWLHMHFNGVHLLANQPCTWPGHALRHVPTVLRSGFAFSRHIDLTAALLATVQIPADSLKDIEKQLPEPFSLWRKLLALGLIFFCGSFNLTILQNLKDSIVVTSAGAETLPYLSACGVLPASFGFFMLYNKILARFPPKWVFAATVAPLTAFYTLFAAVLYPASAALHPQATAALVRCALHVHGALTHIRVLASASSRHAFQQFCLTYAVCHCPLQWQPRQTHSAGPHLAHGITRNRSCSRPQRSIARTHTSRQCRQG